MAIDKTKKNQVLIYCYNKTMSKTNISSASSKLDPDASKIKLAKQELKNLGALYPTPDQAEKERSVAEVQLDNEIKSYQNYDDNLHHAIVRANILNAFGVLLYLCSIIIHSLGWKLPIIVNYASIIIAIMPSIISYTIIRNASNRYLKAEVFPHAQRQGTIIAITIPTLIARVALISFFSAILSHAPGLIGSVIGPAIAILVAITIGSTLQYNFLSNRKIPVDYRLPIINTVAFAFLTIFSTISSLASDAPLNLLQQILSIIAFYIIDQLCAKLSTSWH